jgi:acyl-CoA synthetase (AMP-forming)/AMP-acid ligase II
MGRRTKLVLMHHWDPVNATDTLIEEKVTTALLVPTTLRSLLAEGGARLAATPNLTLRFVAAGGASVPADLIEQLSELFDGRCSRETDTGSRRRRPVRSRAPGTSTSETLRDLHME